ncbi:DnaB-like helicase N-terminal domain-containing protein [Massilia sp. DJPM01]|uniref:DnaB-like helicase N-terminal domain-containing protein n=1 Tax=Massilia sp. DJPM01 TaxID=3024404 RepID=UPI0035A33740
MSSLESGHFYGAEHRMIFEEIVSQIVAGKQVDAVTVAASLGDRVVDALPYLFDLHVSAGSAATISEHAAIVSDRALLRSLVSFGVDVAAQAENAAEPALNVFGRIAQELDSIGQQKDTRCPFMRSLCCPSTWTYSRPVWKGRSSPSRQASPTWIGSLTAAWSAGR